MKDYLTVNHKDTPLELVRLIRLETDYKNDKTDLLGDGFKVDVTDLNQKEFSELVHTIISSIEDDRVSEYLSDEVLELVRSVESNEVGGNYDYLTFSDIRIGYSNQGVFNPDEKWLYIMPHGFSWFSDALVDAKKIAPFISELKNKYNVKFSPIKGLGHEFLHFPEIQCKISSNDEGQKVYNFDDTAINSQYVNGSMLAAVVSSIVKNLAEVDSEFEVLKEDFFGGVGYDIVVPNFLNLRTPHGNFSLIRSTGSIEISVDKDSVLEKTVENTIKGYKPMIHESLKP